MNLFLLASATKRWLFTGLAIATVVVAQAQNEVAIGSATTKTNAILWLNGNGSQGLILPVVTNKSAVSNPDAGMIVYDNSDNKVWYRNNAAWIEVGGSAAGSGDNTTLNLQLTGNQLALRDGTTVLNSVPIAGGTQTNGAFLVFQGGSWQFATLSGDVTGANGTITITNNAITTAKLADNAVTSAKIADATITGADIANNTITPNKLAQGGATNNQVLQWNGTNWVPATISTGGTVTTVSGTAPVTVANPTTTPTISIANAGITNALLADNAVTTAKIQDGTITGADIAALTITSTNIVDNSVTAAKLAPSGATAGQVLKWNGSNWVPQNDDVGSGAVPTLSNGQILIGNGTSNSAAALTGDATLSGSTLTIANNAINSAKIQDGTITGTDIANTTITADKLAASGATSNQILQWNGTNWVPATLAAGGTVTNVSGTAPVTVTNPTTTPTISIANAGITNALIADNAITNPKVADNAITSAKIQDGAITGTDIANISITTDKLAASGAASNQVLQYNGINWVPATLPAGGTVTTVSGTAPITVVNPTSTPTISIAAAGITNTLVADNAINTAKIADNAVTSPKIATTAVDNTKLADNAVTTLKVADNAITSAKIADGEITNADIATAAAIAVNKLAPGTNNQVLTTVSGIPTWQTASTGFSTLNEIPRGNGTGLVSSGIQSDGNNVAIGTIPDALVKLNINDTDGGTALLSGVSGAAATNRGILTTSSGGTNFNYGVDASAQGSGSINYGLRGFADLGTQNYGVFGRVVNGTGLNYGVYGSASSTGTNFGVYGIAGNGTSNWAGYFEGNTGIAGALSVGGTSNFGTAGQVLTSSGPGVAPTWSNPSGGSGWNLTGNAGTSPASNYIGTADAQPLRVATNGVERIRISDTGNVGIGTASPAQRLTVVDAGDFNQFSGTFSVLANNGTQGVGIGYAGIQGIGSNPSQNLALNAKGTGNITMQTVGTTGNVGIGTASPAAKLSVAGDVSADEYLLNANGSGPVPAGGIIMWSGSPAAIPAGYVLCDGSSYLDKLGGTRVTPDLRGRFIVGYSAVSAATPVNATNKEINYGAVGNIGGSNLHTLIIGELPSHNHTGTTANAGAHTHTGTTANAGAHSHNTTFYTGVGGNAPAGIGGTANSAGTTTNGDHNHTFTTASAGDHNHTFTTANTGSGQSHENRPPYFVLAFIMKKY